LAGSGGDRMRIDSGPPNLIGCSLQTTVLLDQVLEDIGLFPES